ncbi:MAG: hypothetical protein ACI85U_003442, partial [Candidatus Promineifilaceae bacterium]
MDGVLVDTQIGLTGFFSSSSALIIGGWELNTRYFDGSLDEVILFDRPLSEAEVYSTAQNEVQGVASVEMWVEEVIPSVDDGSAVRAAAVTAATEVWEAATLTNGAWSFNTPAGYEGFYQMNLHATDNGGNVADKGVIWRGSLDNIAPIVTASGQQVGGGSAAETEYTFTFTDFILDTENSSQPCTAAELSVLTYADSSQVQNGMPYQVSATCRVSGHDSSRDFPACDFAGNCTTLAVAPTSVTGGNVTVVTPGTGSSFIEGALITFSGGAYDPTALTSLTLYANGVQIGTPAIRGSDSSWSLEWSTSVIDNYLIDVVSIGADGTFTDSINISVLQDPYDDLYVDVAGTGDGVVTSDPAGISCNTYCDERYLFTMSVTLTATANTGSAFTGWSGACTGSDVCAVTLNDATYVTATFTINEYDVTTATNGNGNGSISSDPADLINCGSDCAETLDYGTPITLTAVVGLESIFTNWSGDCTGTANCVMTIDQAKDVTADFALNEYTLTTGISGDGSGTV